MNCLVGIGGAACQLGGPVRSERDAMIYLAPRGRGGARFGVELAQRSAHLRVSPIAVTGDARPVSGRNQAH